MNPTLAWPPALTVSLLLHILTAMVLVKTMSPSPVTLTETVRSRFAVSTLSVPSQRAEEMEAETGTAAAGDAAGEHLSVQSIRRVRARPVDAQTDDAPAVRPEGQALSQASLGDTRIQTAAAAQGPVVRPSERAETPLVASATRAEGIEIHAPQGQGISSATPLGTLLATAPPAAAPLSPSRIQGAVVGRAAAIGTEVEATNAATETVAAREDLALRVETDDAAATQLVAAAPDGDAVLGSTPVGEVVESATALTNAVATSRPETDAIAASGGQRESIKATVAFGAEVAAASPSTIVVATVDEPQTAVETSEIRGARVAADIVPAKAVRQATPQTQNLAEISATGKQITAAQPDNPLLASAEDQAPRVSAAATLGVAVRAASPAPHIAFPVPDTGTLVEPDALETARVDPARPVALAVAGAAPRGDGIDPARPDADSVDGVVPAGPAADEIQAHAIADSVQPELTINAETRTQARQAWTGNINTALDTQSLAAIQSFMQPAAVAESEVRDGIGSALARFPCSRLQAAFVPETGGLEVRGHVPIPELRNLVVGLLEQSVGASIPVGGSILVLPQPQCDVLNAVEDLGLPQSVEQVNDPLVVGEAAQADILLFEDGMRVTFRLKAAEYESYTYLDFYDRDGTVQHIMPSEHIRQNRRAANARFTIGGGGEGDIEMIAAPPFGQDIAVFLAATRPLYQGLRPPVEDAVEYLTWLQAHIRALRQEDPGFRGEWAYLFIKTGPQGSFAQP